MLCYQKNAINKLYIHKKRYLPLFVLYEFYAFTFRPQIKSVSTKRYNEGFNDSHVLFLEKTSPHNFYNNYFCENQLNKCRL